MITVDSIFLHDLKNDIQILKMLVAKLEKGNEVVTKLNATINKIVVKCTDAAGAHRLHDINGEIEKTCLNYTEMKILKSFDEKLQLKCNISKLQDTLNNLVKNYQEAGTQTLRITTKFNCIILKGDQGCTAELVDKLNKGESFSTKGEGRGLGTASIRDFCVANRCKLSYHLLNVSGINTLGVKIQLPYTTIVK